MQFNNLNNSGNVFAFLPEAYSSFAPLINGVDDIKYLEILE